MRSFEEIERLLDELREKMKHAEPGQGVECPITEEERYYYTETIQRNRIHAAIAAGDMQEAADIISLSGNWLHKSQRLLLLYAGAFKDPKILFDLIVGVYVNDGYDFPKRLIQLAKRIAPQIPEENRLRGLHAGDTITVYRGTYIADPDCGQELRKATSWTTDKRIAIWFANRIDNPYTANGKGCVWEGTIARNKIIAFTNDRNEHEVIQHMNVQNPHLIEIPVSEWDAALQHHIENKNAELAELGIGD